MKKLLTLILLLFCVLQLFAQSPEQVVRDYARLLNDWLASPYDAAKRDKVVALLQSDEATCTMKDEIVEIYNFDAGSSRCTANNYLSIFSSISKRNVVNININRLKQTVDGNLTIVTAWLDYSGGITLSTVSDFYIKGRQIAYIGNNDREIIKLEANKDTDSGKTPSIVSQINEPALPQTPPSTTTPIVNNDVRTGKVFDASTNEPLIGVTVVQTGIQNGTITDIEGNYTISCPGDASLTFSYIGFRTQTVYVNGKDYIPVYLNDDGLFLRNIPNIQFTTENLLYSAIGETLRKFIPFSRWKYLLLPSVIYRTTICRQLYYSGKKAKVYPNSFAGELLGLSHWSLKNYSIGVSYDPPIRFLTRTYIRLSVDYDQEGYEIEPTVDEKQWIIKRQLVPSLTLGNYNYSWDLNFNTGLSYYIPLHYHDSLINDKNAVNSGFSFNWGVTWHGFGFRMYHMLYDFYNKDFEYNGNKPFADTHSRIVRMNLFYHF